MNIRQKSKSGGFTLVEMLVVIAIIAILAALITAAAASALWSAKQTRIKVEVDSLASAIEAFKQKYGAYPPANLYCIQSGSPIVANPQLTAFVQKAFPRYSVSNGSSIGNQIYLDLKYAGVDTTYMNPQVALVFWLSGFSPDPTDPFNRHNLLVTRTPFFTFEQTRLVLAAADSNSSAALGAAGTISQTGTMFPVGAAIGGSGATVDSVSPGATYGIGQLMYNAPYGNTAYCYLDYQSYGTLYNSGATNAYGGIAGSAAANYGTLCAVTGGGTVEQFLGSSANSFTYPGLSNGTGYVIPYVLDTNNNNTFDAADTFCKPTSFQIISAGQDGAFGTTLSPVGFQGKLYPGGLNAHQAGTVGNNGFSYDSPPPNGGNADDDNVTNFCEKNTLEGAKP
jgi:prepilin-type N-terminal cleavage/methylation domain-containing protein